MMRYFVMAALLCAALAASETWHTAYVDEPVFGSKMRVMQTGIEHNDTVILIHGLGGKGYEDWRGVIPELQKQFHILAFDLPGFGKSDAPAGKYSPGNYAKIIHTLRGKYARGEVTVVGHSMGGAVALRYAADYPEDFATLVLVDAAGILQRTAYVKHMAELPIEMESGPKFLVNTVARVKNFSNTIVEKMNGFSLPVDVLNESDTAWNMLFSDSVGGNAGLSLVEEDFSEVITRIAHRTYILWGDKDGIAPLRTGKMLTGRMQNASLHVFKGADHVPMVSHREQFNRLLMEILNKKVPRTPKKKLPMASSEDLYCQGEAGVTYSGAYDEIIIDRSRAVRLVDVTARKIRVMGSLATFENVSVLSENVALETTKSVIEMTNVTLAGSEAIHAEGSRLDMAGVSLIGDKSAVTIGQESRLVFSASDSSSAEYKGFVHGDYNRAEVNLDTLF